MSPKQTWRCVTLMSAFGGKAEICADIGRCLLMTLSGHSQTPGGLCLPYGRPSACQRGETTASQLNLLCKPRRSERFGVISSNGGAIHGLSHTDEG